MIGVAKLATCKEVDIFKVDALKNLVRSHVKVYIHELLLSRQLWCLIVSVAVVKFALIKKGYVIT